MINLAGKVALVTGGNGGIGLGMAKGLAKAGARIAVWGRNPEKNAISKEILGALTDQVFVQQLDVSNEIAINTGVKEVVERFGRLDAIVAAAGIMGSPERFVELSTSEWRSLAQTNLDSVFWVFREACQHMVARAENGDPGGSLIAVGSTSAIHGAPRHQAYSATKAALLALVRGIAVEHARYGIRANSVLPGWVRSEMTAKLQEWESFNDKAISRVPLGRWGDPDDFGGIAAYLASDLSSFHTGDSIVIDGGYTVF